ncbi:unnamed protein product [Ostreobium quekettii]|uniref:Mediator of RNA polymerase II transcription subunit 8 n=1 Tax=Ostreobium quekettii TaxID=121088 RepID=A0A8S1IYV6_9CHLO|nr:unnamed protein product [Ostreobium quekettii]|eukprot:evm.model.scf_115EXC.11 EVM.evm.TU.scf_115EXC.11   scf_115EXC:121614-126610(+)
MTPGAPSDGKDLLTGSSKTNMNLAVLRRNTEDVSMSLDKLLQTLQFQPNTVQWGAMLDEFSVANMKLAKVREQLRPMLKHYAVHPTTLTQQNAEVVPLLLATKLLPEMEEEEARILGEHGGAAASSTVEGGQFLQLQEKMDNLNGIVLFLTRAQEEANSGLLDPRGTVRSKMKDESLKLGKAIDKVRERLQAARGGVILGQRHARGRGAARGGSRSGRSKSQSDVMLAAMLTGEGLREEQRRRWEGRGEEEEDIRGAR